MYSARLCARSPARGTAGETASSRARTRSGAAAAEVAVRPRPSRSRRWSCSASVALGACPKRPWRGVPAAVAEARSQAREQHGPGAPRAGPRRVRTHASTASSGHGRWGGGAVARDQEAPACLRAGGGEARVRAAGRARRARSGSRFGSGITTASSRTFAVGTASEAGRVPAHRDRVERRRDDDGRRGAEGARGAAPVLARVRGIDQRPDRGGQQRRARRDAERRPEPAQRVPERRDREHDRQHRDRVAVVEVVGAAERARAASAPRRRRRRRPGIAAQPRRSRTHRPARPRRRAAARPRATRARRSPRRARPRASSSRPLRALRQPDARGHVVAVPAAELLEHERQQAAADHADRRQRGQRARPRRASRIAASIAIGKIAK